MAEATVKPKIFGRGTDLDSNRSRYDHVAHEARLKEQRQRAQLDVFAQAVRNKKHWFFKILDERDLSKKWATESQLDEAPDLDALVRYVIRFAALLP
jgi:hypothetical protein